MREPLRFDNDAFDADEYRTELIARGGSFARDWNRDQLAAYAIGEHLGFTVEWRSSVHRDSIHDRLELRATSVELNPAQIRYILDSMIVFDGREWTFGGFESFGEHGMDYGGETTTHGLDLYWRPAL